MSANRAAGWIGWSVLAVMLFVASRGAADETVPVRTISWSALHEARQLTVGEVVRQPGAEPAEWLQVTRGEDDPQSIELIAIDDPGVKAPGYALRGKIRYAGVDPPGYLELWNHFADGSRYFTRTLSEQGSMAKLSGRSGWRDLDVPFFPIDEQGNECDPPTRLVLNLVLPGEGTVSLSALQLVQLGEEEAQAYLGSQSAGGLRVDGRTIPGWTGTVSGVLLGISGGVVGVLSGFGRGRAFVLALMIGWLVVGILFVAVAGVSWLSGRPYVEYFSLLQIGTLATLLCGGLLPVIVRNYRQQELRRMQALDAL